MAKKGAGRNILVGETADSAVKNLTLLFVVSMVCAVFSSVLSVWFYARRFLSAGGQFTLLSVMLMVMAMQAYGFILIKQE